MEKILYIRVKGLLASFRLPFEMNFQKSYPLPPPTTLLGFCGAALGLSEYELWGKEGKEIRRLKLGIYLEKPPGSAKDLMTVFKIKSNKISEFSPYFREVFFYPEYSIVFGGEKDFLLRLYQAFENPKYALSLGREDEIVQIIEMRFEETEEIRGKPVLYGTVIPGDVRKMDFELILNENLKEKLKIEPPIVAKVRTSFIVDQKGRRIAKGKKLLSFLPYSFKISLKSPDFSVYQINGRHFTWMYEGGE